MSYRIKAYLFLLTGAIISGIAGPVIKLTLVALPVDVFLLYRFFISTVLVIFLLPFIKIKIPKHTKDKVNLFIYGFLNSAVALGLLFAGTARTTLLSMSLLSVFGPIIIIFAGYFLLHDHITKREKIGIIFAFLGSFIILVGPFLTNSRGMGQLSGNILVFASLVAGAAAAIYSKKLLKDGADPWSLTSISFAIGFMALLIYILIKGNFMSSMILIMNLPINYHLGVFYMAIFSGTLAYYLGNIALKSIEVSEAAIFNYIYPVISALLAIYIFGDTIDFIIIVGSIITFLGVVLAEWKKKRYTK